MYTLTSLNENCISHLGAIEKPDGIITTDAKSFIQWMLGLTGIENLVKDQKLLFEGRVGEIVMCLDAVKLQNAMQRSIIATGGTERRTTFEKDIDITLKAAELLGEGKIIGWFQGGSEFGPRGFRPSQYFGRSEGEGS